VCSLSSLLFRQGRIQQHNDWHARACAALQEDPREIAETAKVCLAAAATWAAAHGRKVACLGVTNQRETTVVWERGTGASLHNALVWLDTRTKELVETFSQSAPAETIERVRVRCGLPLATYFSALKLRWLLDNVPAVSAAASRGDCMFGTVDSWLLYNLTGGKAHVTDVTNASRTMLMSLESLSWDDELLAFFKIPVAATTTTTTTTTGGVLLPTICSSSEVYGTVAEDWPLAGIPVCGCLGDQQAALVGQLCLGRGLAKCTYGTGCFMLRNTGTEAVRSRHGLLTTVAYKLGPKAPASYALEGSVAIAGAAVQWLRDGLGIIREASEADVLARSVPETGGVYIVPAFSGLFAPRWRTDARGAIVGITQYTTKAHLSRAVFEATCFQTLEVLEAMAQDANSEPLAELRVDGGMTRSNLLPQLQADLLGLPVSRPEMRETTALGAAIAAGLAVGVLQLQTHPNGDVSVPGVERNPVSFLPTTTTEEREKRLARWKMAVERSLNWV